MQFSCETRPILFAEQHDRHVVNSASPVAGARSQLLPRLRAVHRVSSNNADCPTVAVRKHPPVGDVVQSSDGDFVTGNASDVDVRYRSNARRKRESTQAHIRDAAHATAKDHTQKNSKQMLPEIVYAAHVAATKGTSSNGKWITTFDWTNCDDENAHRSSNDADVRDTRHTTNNREEELSSIKRHLRPIVDGCPRVPTDDIETAASVTTDSMPTATKIEVVLPTLDGVHRSGGRSVSVRHGVNAVREDELGGMMPVLLKYRIDLLRQQQQDQHTGHRVVGTCTKSLQGQHELKQQATDVLSTDRDDKTSMHSDNHEAPSSRPPDDERRTEASAVDAAEVRGAEWKMPLPMTTTSTTTPVMTLMAPMKDDSASRKRGYPVLTKASGSSVKLSPVRHRLPNFDVHHAMTTIPLGADPCRLIMHHRNTAAAVVPRRRIERDNTIITQPPTPDAVDVRWLRLACRRTSDDKIARDRMPVFLPVCLQEQSNNFWRTIEF